MLQLRQWFIREHVGLMKLTDTYDILDPATNSQIGIAKEEPGAFITILRLLVNKQLLPTKVCVYAGSQPGGEPLFSMQRGVSFLRARVTVRGPDQTVLGWFTSKIMSLGGAFTVFQASGQEVASVKGDWKGWNFKITAADGREIGQVTKKWGGLGKELFTSADNYIVNLTGDASEGDATLLLAAGLAVDMIYKEGR